MTPNRRLRPAARTASQTCKLLEFCPSASKKLSAPPAGAEEVKQPKRPSFQLSIDQTGQFNLARASLNSLKIIVILFNDCRSLRIWASHWRSSLPRLFMIDAVSAVFARLQFHPRERQLFAQFLQLFAKQFCGRQKHTVLTLAFSEFVRLRLLDVQQIMSKSLFLADPTTLRPIT